MYNLRLLEASRVVLQTKIWNSNFNTFSDTVEVDSSYHYKTFNGISTSIFVIGGSSARLACLSCLSRSTNRNSNNNKVYS